MRNLKKILALVLALMMVLSVMVTASASFKDVEDINPDYLEAVTVMAEAGILVGTGNGFEPTVELNRASAAKLVAYVAEGPAAKAYNAKCETVFDDVKATDWASGFIAYASDAEYIKGNGEGFDPDGTLTIEQYAAMLLRVLGVPGEYTGAKWYVAVRNNAKNEGLMAGIKTYAWTNAVTREIAAQMTFNALNWVAEGAATGYYLIVPAENLDAAKVALIKEINKTPFTSMADAVVYMTALKLDLGVDYTIKPQTTTAGTLMANYTELVNPAAGEYDEFGRPLANVWKDKDGVIIYAEEVAPVKTYTAATTAKKIAEDLKGYKLGGVKVESKDVLPASVAVFNNGNGHEFGSLSGADKTASAKLAGITANGKVLEVYADQTTKTITGIVWIEYSVDEILASKADKNGTVTYTVGGETYKDYTDEYIAAQAAKKNYLADEIVLNGDVAHEDHVTYVVLDNGVAQVYATEAVEGVLSRKTANGQFLTIGGEKIAVGNAKNATAYAAYEIDMDEAQVFVLDQYGYVVALYTDGTPATVVPTDFVYVLNVQTQDYNTGSDQNQGSLIGGANVTGAKDPAAVASVVFPDGTAGLINLKLTNVSTNPLVPDYEVVLPAADGTVAKDGLDNGKYTVIGGAEIGNWFAYTVDENGAYTLSAVDAKVAQVVDGLTMTKNAVTSFTVGTGKVYTNSATTVNGINFNAVTKKYDTTKVTGLVAAGLTGNVLVVYGQNAKTVAGIYAFGQNVTAPADPVVTYAMIVAMGDELANGTEYYAYINGKLEVVVINNGKDPVNAGLCQLVANTGKLAGTFKTAAHGLSVVVNEEKVELVDATYFVAGTNTCYFDKNCVVYNLTGLAEGTATGAADVVEAGDYVVAYNAGTDSDVDLIFIVDKPEA